MLKFVQLKGKATITHYILIKHTPDPLYEYVKLHANSLPKYDSFIIV